LNNILLNIEDYVYHLHSKNSIHGNVFHNFPHTKKLVEIAEVIGNAARLKDADLEIVKVAAWFYDIGFLNKNSDPAKQSAEAAVAFLSQQNYPAENIEIAKNSLLSFDVDHNPGNPLEEVLSDSVNYYIGTKNYHDKSELMRMEIENFSSEKISERKWLKREIEILSIHKYYTKHAIEKYEGQQYQNLLLLHREIKKNTEKKDITKQKKEKVDLDKEKIRNKNLLDKKATRGIETMFRNAIRTHVSFSSMADTKANIMISVNTLLLGAVGAILVRKLDTNPYLIVPTIVLTVVSLVTLIFAILVTRPSISSGSFTKDDILNKKANLLFFGNFYQMSFKDFAWGMQQMMNDKEYLYENMTKDFYSLGQVLGKKYKYLRICYTFFMYGIIITTIVFAIFIAIDPGMADAGAMIK